MAVALDRQTRAIVTRNNDLVVDRQGFEGSVTRALVVEASGRSATPGAALRTVTASSR